MTAPPALQEAVAALASEGNIQHYFSTARESLDFLSGVPREECVNDENYFFFRFDAEGPQKLSRPVNATIFELGAEHLFRGAIDV